MQNTDRRRTVWVVAVVLLAALTFGIATSEAVFAQERGENGPEKAKSLLNPVKETGGADDKSKDSKILSQELNGAIIVPATQEKKEDNPSAPQKKDERSNPPSEKRSLADITTSAQNAAKDTWLLMFVWLFFGVIFVGLFILLLLIRNVDRKGVKYFESQRTFLNDIKELQLQVQSLLHPASLGSHSPELLASDGEGSMDNDARKRAAEEFRTKVNLSLRNPSEELLRTVEMLVAHVLTKTKSGQNVAEALPAKQLTAMQTRMDEIEKTLQGLSAGLSSVTLGGQYPTSAIGGSAVDSEAMLSQLQLVAAQSELRILQKTWKELFNTDGMKGLFNLAFKHKEQPEYKLTRGVLTLADNLAGVDGMGSSITKIVEPVRRYLVTLGKLEECTKLKNTVQVGGEQLDALREANLYLGILFNYDQARESIGLDFQTWLANHFPRLADEFYREYQSAKHQNRADAFEAPKQQVDDILGNSLNLKVVDISLGRTVFDTRFHVARSTTKVAGMLDGTIASVIKNGFMRSDGAVTQQAEVIVNRI